MGDEGIVYDLGNFVRKGGNGFTFRFDLKLDRSTADVEKGAPVVLIAFASPNGLESADGEQFPAVGDKFMQRVAEEIRRSAEDVSVGVQYFKLVSAD